MRAEATASRVGNPSSVEIGEGLGLIHTSIDMRKSFQGGDVASLPIKDRHTTSGDRRCRCQLCRYPRMTTGDVVLA